MPGIFETIFAFMDKGGNVLWLIAVLVFFMWTLIFERLWYFSSSWKADRAQFIARWEGRSECRSWNAKQIRMRLISTSRELINDNMNVISTCVALCPLLGLLGTVTGMIEVLTLWPSLVAAMPNPWLVVLKNQLFRRWRAWWRHSPACSQILICSEWRAANSSF